MEGGGGGGKKKRRFESDRVGFSAYVAALNLPFLPSHRLVKAGTGIGSELFNLAADSSLPICSQYHRVFVDCFRVPPLNSKAPPPASLHPLDFDASSLSNGQRISSHMRVSLLPPSFHIPPIPYIYACIYIIFIHKHGGRNDYFSPFANKSVVLEKQEEARIFI